MLDDAALALEEIVPEDKTRTEVLGARIALYVTAKKWDMAAAIASHLVKVDPGTAGWWISLAYALRRTESIEKAEAILFRAQAIHPEFVMIVFKPGLLCERSRASWKRRKSACGMPLSLIRKFGNWRSKMKILKPFGTGSAV